MAFHIQRRCLICQGSFEFLESRLRLRSADYCSRACYSSEQAAVGRFWKAIRRTPTCWMWFGAKTGFGYGHLHFMGKHWLAHRLSYTLAHGAIPDGLQVIHSCDNPPCVNPAHLSVGTISDNIKDGVRKGRIIPPKRTKH